MKQKPRTTTLKVQKERNPQNLEDIGESEYGWMSFIQTKSAERSDDNRDDQKSIETELKFLHKKEVLSGLDKSSSTDNDGQNSHTAVDQEGNRKKYSVSLCQFILATRKQHRSSRK